MRLLALLLIFLTSGVGHVVVDAADDAGIVADRAGGCDDCDDEAQDCSPVCHDCVCSAGARVLASSGPLLSWLDTAPVQLEPTRRPVIAAAFSAPRPPLLSGVFHPPKA